MEKTELVKAVRDHADKTADYATNNWDILLECYGDAEIAEEIGEATTLESAIENVLKVLDLVGEVQFGRFFPEGGDK